MKPYILNKIKALVERYTEIQAIFENITKVTDQKQIKALTKEYAQLSKISQLFTLWQQYRKSIKSAQMMINDPEMYEIVKEEIQKTEKYLKNTEQQLYLMLLPKDPDNDRNVFIEIHAGTGGEEAALFSSDLFRMYSRYAEFRHWCVEIISMNEGEYGGYKEIIAKIRGNKVYERLKFESGGHRVQRIPVTESQGRIHTSTCTVAVIPELPEEELPSINPADLRIDTFRSSGAGGQHVNTTDSAIRVTHLPTGIIVECQNERSQHKNKAKALSVLSARIRAAEISKRHKSETSVLRNLLGSGNRGDRNRTYNFQQGRVTDHRINLTLYCLEDIMEGKIDVLIEPIFQKYLSNQLETLVEN